VPTIVVPLGLLYAGAEMLVRESAALALRAGIAPLFVGLTIVAYGTSGPELAVSGQAAVATQLRGTDDMVGDDDRTPLLPA
jgi:cation:H+ antiporter